jgi:acyl CoA:acetate/3-ketoacid CoA transferase
MRPSRQPTRVLSAEDAVALVPDRATVAVGGTGAVLEADLVLESLERRFLAEGRPQGLTVVSPMLPGDRPGVGGLNCFAHEGMLARIIGASFHRQRHPRLLEMLRAGTCEGYIVGMGTMIQLMTAIGAGKPGVLTTVGLGSFMDPRVEGGAMNDRSKTPPVRLLEIDGGEFLYYPAFPIDVAIVRGTTADENGYVSMEEEPNSLGMVEIAMAAKARGGLVIAQVKRLARAGSLDPRLVRIPGPLVDVVVVHPTQKQLSPSMADPAAGWNPFLAGALKAPYRDLKPVEPGATRIILRRAALELRHRDVVNLGAGVATHLPRIALEEGVLDEVVFTNEHGIFGGLMATALGGSFVPALNADAIMDSVFQFNFYDGGGLDITFLGIGQVDRAGNLNVSRFGQELMGPGGFNNITDRTPRIVFCGSLTAGGLEVEAKDGRLSIVKEGRHKKFVEAVEQITLNAARAHAQGQSVRYITERAVFELDGEGIVLTEIAPGIDLDRDVRPHVGFALRVAPDLRPMDSLLFTDQPLGLAARFSGDKS